MEADRDVLGWNKGRGGAGDCRQTQVTVVPGSHSGVWTLHQQGFNREQVPQHELHFERASAAAVWRMGL